MRALRALIAVLLGGLAAAGGSHASAQPAPASAGVCAEAGTELTRAELPPGPDTFLGSSPTTSLPGAVEEGGRTHPPVTRTLRPAKAPSRVPAARVAAVTRDRLDFAQSLHMARLGWSSFGSTSPPPFRI